MASFTAQMLDEGTETRSSQDIAAAFEFMGARLSTDSGYEFTLLSTETLSRHWSQALTLLADLVKHPTFPQHELERVRRQSLTDLRRVKDDPTSIADQIMPGLLFGRSSSYGHPPFGTEAAVAALSREDILQQFRRHYSPQNATLLVVGDASTDEVVDQAEAELGGWSSAVGADASNHSPHSPLSPGADGEMPVPANLTVYLVDKPGAAQSVLRAGHLTIPRQHPDYFGLSLLNHAFGGQFSARLNQNLRETKGYTYGFHSWVHWYQGPSSLLVGGSVQTAVTKESVQETLREFTDIQGRRPLGHDEFEMTKEAILRAYPASFERPAQVLSHLMQWVLHDLPADYFQTVRARVEALSLAEVNRIASQRVQPDRLKVLVVGDRRVIEPGLRELGLPLVLLDFDGAELGQ
jgi:zinc protease